MGKGVGERVKFVCLLSLSKTFTYKLNSLFYFLNVLSAFHLMLIGELVDSC